MMQPLFAFCLGTLIWGTYPCLAQAVGSEQPLVTISGSTQNHARSESAGPAHGLSQSLDIEALKKLRDPFKRIMLQEQDDHPKGDLETMQVSDLSLVGILVGPHKTRAMVKGTNGKTYVIADGTRIGTQSGYVRKILEDRVIVNEVMTDLLGEKEVVTHEIRLLRDKEILSRVAGDDEAKQPETATPKLPLRRPLKATKANLSAGLQQVVQQVQDSQRRQSEALNSLTTAPAANVKSTVPAK